MFSQIKTKDAEFQTLNRTFIENSLQFTTWIFYWFFFQKIVGL